MEKVRKIKIIDTLDLHKQAQEIARQTINYLAKVIYPGMTEIEICQLAKKRMDILRVNSYWYYNVPALVYIGIRTKLSLSGKEYKPTDTKIEKDDVITIDLSPAVNGFWGDFSRTLIVHKGEVMDFKNEFYGRILGSEMHFVMVALSSLHRLFNEVAREKMTFGGIYEIITQAISEANLVNLDFRGNLGHTIQGRLAQRRFIEKGNELKLGEAELFTFEPHIAAIDGRYGFKREDIYYFQEGKLKIL